MQTPPPEPAQTALGLPLLAAQAPAWLERLTSHLQTDPRGFWLELGINVLLGLAVSAVVWFIVARWARGARQRLASRDLWDEERRAAERTRIDSLSRYLRNLALGLGGLVTLGLFALNYQIPGLEDLAIAVRTWLLTGGIGDLVRIGLVALAIGLILRVVRAFAEALTPTSGERFEREIARATTIRTVFESTIQVALLVVFVLYALSELGAEVGALLAGVGILGLAISFGAQSLVKDLISGFFILFENQYGVGDIVALGGLSGTVESINLRITTLRDIEGNVHIIPNGTIDKVTVMSREWARSVIDVEVAYKTELERALDILGDEAKNLYEDPEWQWRILEPPETLGVDAFEGSGIRLRLMFKTLPKEQWSVGREFRKRIKARFDREGIDIPYPHVTLFWGDKQKPQSTGTLNDDGEALSNEAVGKES